MSLIAASICILMCAYILYSFLQSSAPVLPFYSINSGCLLWTDTFWTNPQYRVTVVDADEQDDDNTGTLIVALLQKDRRLKRSKGCELLTIGYTIYRVS